MSDLLALKTQTVFTQCCSQLSSRLVTFHMFAGVCVLYTFLCVLYIFLCVLYTFLCVLYTFLCVLYTFLCLVTSNIELWIRW